MSTNVTVTVHAVAEDGLPDMDREEMVGCIAFIWNGAIVSGWPIGPEYEGDDDPDEVRWEPSEDRFGGPVMGVTHWVEFPEPPWRYEK